MKRNAQSTLEYVVLICLLVGVLVGMQVYFKRSIQGKIKSNSEQIGSVSYSPGATIADINILRESSEESNTFEEEINGVNESVSETTANMRQETNRSENVLSIDQEPVR